jgi:hypothetical protein
MFNLSPEFRTDPEFLIRILTNNRLHLNSGTCIKQEKPCHHDLTFLTNQQNLTFIKNENIV